MAESSNSPHIPKSFFSSNTTNIWKAFAFQVYWIFLKAECQSSLYIQNMEEINNHILSSKLYSTQKLALCNGYYKTTLKSVCWTVPRKHTT